jgi:hypothetical protein
MEFGFQDTQAMKTTPSTEYVHEGHYAAEVDVTLIGDDEGWGPYLSLDDANKLDDVRLALRRGDLAAASALARVFEMTPIAAE